MFACCETVLQCLGGLVVAYCAYSLAIKLWYFVTTYCFKRKLDASKYGKWTVITGASDGIGKQFALQFAKRGQNIVLISKSLDRLEDLANYIESEYGVQTKVVDVDFKGGAEIYERIAEVVAGLDVGVLINNVGRNHPFTKFTEIPEVDRYIDEVISVNIMSQLKMSNMILPGMTRRKRGLIINVTSASATLHVPNMSLYGSSKAFMDYFSRSIALEYEKDGIDIVSLMPCFVSTNIISNQPPSFWIRRPEEFVDNAMSAVASGCKLVHGCWQHDLQVWLFCNLPYSFIEADIQNHLKPIKTQD